MRAVSASVSVFLSRVEFYLFGTRCFSGARRFQRAVTSSVKFRVSCWVLPAMVTNKGLREETGGKQHTAPPAERGPVPGAVPVTPRRQYDVLHLQRLVSRGWGLDVAKVLESIREAEPRRWDRRRRSTITVGKNERQEWRKREKNPILNSRVGPGEPDQSWRDGWRQGRLGEEGQVKEREAWRREGGALHRSVCLKNFVTRLTDVSR